MRIALLLIIAFAGFSFTIQSWEKFTSVEGRFTILTPGVMDEKVNELETPIGKLSYHSFVYQQEGQQADNLVYLVSYCDYPEHTIHADSIELLDDFFQATIESAVESVAGELLYAADNYLNGHPAKLWKVNYKDNQASIKSKACMVKNRYYSVQTVTLSEKGLNKSIAKFMDSFVIHHEE